MAIVGHADWRLAQHRARDHDDYIFNCDQLPSVRSDRSRATGLLPFGRQD
jgi:hypothetical protein